MGVVQPAGDGLADANYFIDRHELTLLLIQRHDFGEIVSIDIFHGVVGVALGVVCVIDLDDVLMPPFCHHAGFVDKAAGVHGIVLETFIDELDRNVAV